MTSGFLDFWRSMKLVAARLAQPGRQIAQPPRVARDVL